MSRFDTNLDIDAITKGFTVRKDDFSVQVSLPDDHLFWIRVEAGELVTTLSDLNPGNQKPQTTATGLLFALTQAGRDPFSNLRILNIAPSADDLISRRESLRQVLSHHAASQGRFIEKIETQQFGRKCDLLVSFT